MTKEGVQAGTGGLGDGLDEAKRIEAPTHGPVTPAKAPHSDGMFGPMHGSRAPPGEDDLEDRTTGTETLELLLGHAVESGDDVLVEIYATELSNHLESHGLQTGELDAMTAAVRHRARRTQVRETNDLWRTVRAEACRVIVRAKIAGRTVTLVAALNEVEPSTP